MNGTLELLPVPEASTGLCRACRADAALPESEFCRDCTDELHEVLSVFPPELREQFRGDES